MKGIFLLVLSMSLCHAKASPSIDEVVAQAKTSALTACRAAYTIWYSDHHGQKQVPARLRSLIQHACAGRFFISSLKCTQNTFDALDLAKARGATEVPAEVHAESKACLDKVGVQSKQDTQLLAEYASSGQRSQLQETLKKWQQEGSLKFFKRL